MNSKGIRPPNNSNDKEYPKQIWSATANEYI